MIVTCYAHLISMARKSNPVPSMSNLTVGVGTTPNARKNPYLVLDFYVQD
jgi:hypothetical protein